MSAAKRQGTAHESWIVKLLRAAGYTDARRLPLQGSLDEGDLEVTLAGLPVTVEAKARSVLNVQATLGGLRIKVKGKRIPIVVWKRLVKVDGYKVRQPVAGERVTVSLSLDDFLTLLRHAAISNTPNSNPAITPSPELEQAA